jgi:hypothetical protein
MMFFLIGTDGKSHKYVMNYKGDCIVDNKIVITPTLYNARLAQFEAAKRR